MNTQAIVFLFVHQTLLERKNLSRNNNPYYYPQLFLNVINIQWQYTKIIKMFYIYIYVRLLKNSSTKLGELQPYRKHLYSTLLRIDVFFNMIKTILSLIDHTTMWNYQQCTSTHEYCHHIPRDCSSGRCLNQCLINRFTLLAITCDILYN